jgi:ATP-dependent Clp protease ATP-binding subunit ClpA
MKRKPLSAGRSNVLKLSPELKERLDNLGVVEERHSPDTLILRSVPVNPRYYNKPCTNLLIRRFGPGMPFLKCVDEDLQYTGTAKELVRAFAGSHKRAGWQALPCEPKVTIELGRAVEAAMRALGTGGAKPTLAPASVGDESDAASGLLNTFGESLTERAVEGTLQPCMSRCDAVDEVASCMLRWSNMRMALIIGESGTGKTNLLHGAAEKLLRRRPDMHVRLINLCDVFSGTLFDAERDSLLENLLNELAQAPETILAVEHLELAIRATDRGALLLAKAVERGAKIIGTTLPVFWPQVNRAPLARRIHAVPLSQFNAQQTEEVLLALSQHMAEHYLLQIDQNIVRAAVATSESLEGINPAKAIAVLDGAAARASLNGTQVVGIEDLCYSASRYRERERSDLADG